MTDSSRPADQTVLFFGFDQPLRTALKRAAAARLIDLCCVQTVAGLMLAARARPVPVLILQGECLPPGRSPAALLDRLEAQTGARPLLICLAPRSRLPADPAAGAGPGVCREAVASFRAPYDAPLIIERVAQALCGQADLPARVLLLDAVAEEGEAYAAALRYAGLLVERIKDPRQAVAALERRPAALVILDLECSDNAGRELAVALHAHPVLRGLPILFLTEPVHPDYANDVLCLGHDEYLGRPVSPERLVAAVQKRLARGAGALGHRLRPAPPGRADSHGTVAADDDPPDETQVLDWLRAALAGPGFYLVYQPILSLRRSRRERYETLLRLRTPAGEVLSPSRFLPVAARHGLLPALDRWTLDAGLATLRRERDASHPTRLVIFQSGASLAESGWIDRVRAEILRLDLVRHPPALEFSVQDILDNEDRARVLFPELGRLGIEICLAGVSDDPRCLGLIARRPITTAKLARDLAEPRATKRLRNLVGALHRRHARVIAAGIEDPAAIGRVWSTGVDYVQGHFIQPPLGTLGFQFREGVIG